MPPKPEPQPRSPSLLSPARDDDVSSLRSPSEQDSDSEDDQFLQGSRTTLELAEHDRKVLEEEEELEKLLTKKGRANGLRRIFSPNGGSVKIGKRRRQRRRERRDRQRGGREKTDEEGELMYEMEEGYRDDASSQPSTPSTDFDRRELDGFPFTEPKRALFRRLFLIFSAIVVLFLILLLGAYKASGGFRASHRHKLLRSNGTALFAPTTILISLDGFRADYLNRGLTPNLNSLIAGGVSPQYMLPSFPSVTFPNHFTLVTGLYPESHGIVGNTFWDPELEDEFETGTPVITQSKWWKAEPLWVTAEEQGVRTAIHMWPGSEAHIGNVDPTFVDRFNGSEELPRKVDRILQFLDLPGEEDDSYDGDKRPQFIAAYVPNVDAAGHKYGPNSTEIRSTIAQADNMLGSLFHGIEERNLTDIVNIVIVSDHGMATTSTARLVQLDDLIDIDLVERIDGWPSRGLRPKRPEDLQTLHKQLAKVAKNYADRIEVYTRETMPERYHFSSNERIAPLWVIPKAGWAVVERPEFDAKEALETGKAYHPRGIHGYDHEHPLMRAIFIARGPAFPHKPNSRVEVFQNIEVYNIICDSLGVKPLANNGTLRLPLKPVGLHSDENAPVLDSPHDPPLSSVVSSETNSLTVPSPTSSAAEFTPTPSSDAEDVEDAKDAGNAEDAGTAEDAEDTDDEDSQPKTWWGKLMDKVETFKEWASELIESAIDNHPSR